jgi:hypothetical protein
MYKDIEINKIKEKNKKCLSRFIQLNINQKYCFLEVLL